jgi:hypothetical protein
MTPKEKATELVNRFYFKLSNNGSLSMGLNSCDARYKESIQCALITCNRTIDILKEIRDKEHSDNFWYLENAILEEMQVKKEIELL